MSPLFIVTLAALIAALLPVMISAYPDCLAIKYVDEARPMEQTPKRLYLDCAAGATCRWNVLPTSAGKVYLQPLDFKKGVNGRLQLKNDGDIDRECAAVEYGSRSWYFRVSPGERNQCNLEVPADYNLFVDTCYHD